MKVIIQKKGVSNKFSRKIKTINNVKLIIPFLKNKKSKKVILLYRLENKKYNLLEYEKIKVSTKDNVLSIGTYEEVKEVIS